MQEEKKKKKEEKSVEKVEKGVPAIPDDKLRAVMDVSGDQTQWLKTVEGGFKVIKQDKFLKNVTGRIISLDPYLMKFENGVPTKLPHVADHSQIPAGYERRCDIKILVADQQLVGISLPPSSFEFNLSPYIKFLHGKGLRPEEVMTKVFSQQASNPKGTWPVACFELVDEQSSEPSSKIPSEWK